MTGFDALMSAIYDVLNDYYCLPHPYEEGLDSLVSHVSTQKINALHQAYNAFRVQQIALENGEKRP